MTTAGCVVQINKYTVYSQMCNQSVCMHSEMCDLHCWFGCSQNNSVVKCVFRFSITLSYVMTVERLWLVGNTELLQ